MQTQIDRAAMRGNAARVAELEAEIEPFPMPAGGVGLWNAFIRLSNRRGSNGYGPLAITWQEIDAFQRVSRVELDPWEIETIEALDAVYLQARSAALEGRIIESTSA